MNLAALAQEIIKLLRPMAKRATRENRYYTTVVDVTNLSGGDLRINAPKGDKKYVVLAMYDQDTVNYATGERLRYQAREHSDFDFVNPLDEAYYLNETDFLVGTVLPDPAKMNNGDITVYTNVGTLDNRATHALLLVYDPHL